MLMERSCACVFGFCMSFSQIAGDGVLVEY